MANLQCIARPPVQSVRRNAGPYISRKALAQAINSAADKSEESAKTHDPNSSGR